MLFFLSCGQTSQRFGDSDALHFAHTAEYSADLAKLGTLRNKIAGSDIYRPRIFTLPAIRNREGLSRDPDNVRTKSRFPIRFLKEVCAKCRASESSVDAPHPNFDKQAGLCHGLKAASSFHRLRQFQPPAVLLFQCHRLRRFSGGKKIVRSSPAAARQFSLPAICYPDYREEEMHRAEHPYIQPRGRRKTQHRGFN